MQRDDEMLSDWFARRAILQAPLPDGGSIALRFTSPVEEHLATRRAVGLFDFSFMGWWEVAGREARACLERLQTRDLEALAPGKIFYTLLCRDDGSVFIDATVWCVDCDRYWLCSGRRSDIAHIAVRASSFDVDVTPLHDGHSVIAVQGPASTALVEQALPVGDVESLRRFAFRREAFDGHDAWIARLGYTGEVGYEIVVPAEAGVPLWRRLVETPFDDERRECGMEAANSLRIEAGYIHFAHELRQPVFPDEIGLSRLLRTAKPDFIGAHALASRRTAKRRMMGVRLSQADADDVRRSYSAQARVDVTSEAYSPTFDSMLALAFVDVELAGGASVATRDGRTATLVDLPFYTRASRNATSALVR